MTFATVAGTSTIDIRTIEDVDRLMILLNSTEVLPKSIRAYKFVTCKLQSPYVGSASWSCYDGPKSLRKDKRSYRLRPGIRRFTYNVGNVLSVSNPDRDSCGRGIHCASLEWCLHPIPIPRTVADPVTVDTSDHLRVIDARYVAIEFTPDDVYFIGYDKIVLTRCTVVAEVDSAGNEIHPNLGDKRGVTEDI